MGCRVETQRRGGLRAAGWGAPDQPCSRQCARMSSGRGLVISGACVLMDGGGWVRGRVGGSGSGCFQGSSSCQAGGCREGWPQLRWGRSRFGREVAGISSYLGWGAASPPRPLMEASLPWLLPLACDRRSEAAWLQAWVWGTLSCLCAGGYSRAPSHPQLERWETTCPERSGGARVMGRFPVLSAEGSSRRIPLCRAEDTGAGRGGDGAHRPWPWGCRRGAGNGVRGFCRWACRQGECTAGVEVLGWMRLPSAEEGG